VFPNRKTVPTGLHFLSFLLILSSIIGTNSLTLSEYSTQSRTEKRGRKWGFGGRTI
jgi:hypothetical protein